MHILKYLIILCSHFEYLGWDRCLDKLAEDEGSVSV